MANLLRGFDQAGCGGVGTAIFADGGLNDCGQIVYHALLVDGDQIIRRWTPDLHWRSSTDGNWDTGNNNGLLVLANGILTGFGQINGNAQIQVTWFCESRVT